ncbi:MAG: glycosyltransferase family 2 protein [Paracoccaceae bacterium]
MSDRVTIVTVCFNSLGVLPAMLASVPERTPVVLVDNASDDLNTLRELAAQYGARLMENDENRGFGTACNQAAALAGTEFLLFLNPDTELAPDTIDQLIGAAARYPKASAFNPRIAQASGAPYFKRHSHLMPRAEIMPRGWPGSDQEVTVVSGAALFVRRAAFEEVGGFDPGIFLYHEDDDLGRRLRAQVGPLMFIRDANVTHQMGRSTKRSPATATLKAWHMGRSRVYASRKHGRPVPFLSALMSASLQLFSPAVALSKRKRAKQVAFFKGILSTLRDGGKSNA